MTIETLVNLVVMPLCDSDDTSVQRAGQAILWNLVYEGHLEEKRGLRSARYPQECKEVDLYIGETYNGRRCTTIFFLHEVPLTWEERHPWKG